MKITRKRNVINKAGIFAGSLFVAATAVYLYSPVIGSHADTAVVGAEVNAMIALTTPENLRLEVTPSAAGATASDSVTATVNTNSTYGYELYFSATDTNTDMTSTSSSATITSDFTTTSLANIPVNSWGYSLDDTDYSPIPTSENSTRIRSIEHLPAGNELTTSIHFGTKVDSTLASGFYSDDVVFSAVAIAPPEPIIPSMQNFDPSMLSDNGDSMQVVDERDGSTYTVKRLRDGKVWMTQNLRLVNKTITSEDSNLPSGETYTIPASDITAFTEDYNTSAAYLDSTYGGYYNFYTATAGWGTSDKGENELSPKDICPKGWRLPTIDNYTYDEFEKIRMLYSLEELIDEDGPEFSFGGDIFRGEFDEDSDGSWGEYWTGVSFDNEYAIYYFVEDYGYSESSTGSNMRVGMSVRCVAKETTMQTFDETSMIPNVGNSIRLTDIRDGTRYDVKRLADGKVWMTENLRIANMEITSDDSNLPSEESYRIPGSGLSSFAGEFSGENVNATYVDPTHGGYYTFYTATAGWGDVSFGMTSGDSPQDICPKGWRLPTSNHDGGDFHTLYSKYNSFELMQGEPAFTLSGYVTSGQTAYINQNLIGNYWSSSLVEYDYHSAFSLELVVVDSEAHIPENPDVDPSRNYYFEHGFSVRCLAK